MGTCDANPVYASDGQTCDREEAIAYCQATCEERATSGTGCEGFFFQKHDKGHEICGFYSNDMDDQGQQIWGGHQRGAICQRKGTWSYEVVTSGDCTGTALIDSVDECKQAIADVFGVQDANVEQWNTSAYAKGCFKSNYGNPGSAQAASAPTKWVFNLDGGPGTSGHPSQAMPLASAVMTERPTKFRLLPTPDENNDTRFSLVKIPIKICFTTNVSLSPC